MATAPPTYLDKLPRIEASSVALAFDCYEFGVLGVVVVEGQTMLLGISSMLRAQVAAEVNLGLFGVVLVLSSRHLLS